jgi:hypothetical protein
VGPGLEPGENIAVDTKRNRLLGNRVHDRGLVPEIIRQAREFRWGGALNLAISDATQFGKIRTPALWAFTHESHPG